LVPPKVFPVEKLGLVDASMVGKFILIEGICLGFITKITKLKLATYFCKFCGSKIHSKINNSTFEPVIYCFSETCEKKYTRKLFLDVNMSNFKTYHLVKISNIKDKTEVKPSIGEIDIYFNEKLCGNFNQGIKIRSAGTVLPCGYECVVPVKFSMNFFFQSMFIEKHPYSYRTEKPFLIKQNYIFELLRSPDLYDRISESILPYFLGDLDLKKSITLALANSSSNLKKTMFEIQQQINILFIGDFNIGKLSILHELSSISPNAIYINSSSNSLKTHFQSISEFKNNFSINKELDSQILNTELILIENVLFLKEDEIFFLEKCLEDQLAWSEKIVSNATIIASIANFENFEFQKTKKTNYSINSFLRNFDLVFFQDQKPISNFNEKISSFLLENYGKEKLFKKKENFFNKEILKVLFKECQHIYPKFTKSSIEMVIYNYVLLKATDMEKFRKNINIKFLISIIKLSMALAKLNFKDLISVVDTKEATRLITSSIRTQKDFKLSSAQLHKISIENKIYNLIRKTSLQTKKSILHLPYLAKLSSSMGYPRENFAKCLEIYENLNIWAISLKQMKLVFLF